MITAEEVGLLPAGLLAYIGDSVYEVKVREYYIKKGLRTLNNIHQASIGLVNATTQANILKGIEGILTPREASIVRRGRNAGTGNVPKNADMIEYRLSTGLEALFGYHYLSGNQKRLDTIWEKIVDFLEKNDL